MPKNEKGREVVDLHINTNARRRQLSVGKLLPSEWGWVRVTRTRSDDGNVWLHIRKLELREG